MQQSVVLALHCSWQPMQVAGGKVAVVVAQRAACNQDLSSWQRGASASQPPTLASARHWPAALAQPSGTLLHQEHGACRRLPAAACPHCASRRAQTETPPAAQCPAQCVCQDAAVQRQPSTCSSWQTCLGEMVTSAQASTGRAQVASACAACAPGKSRALQQTTQHVWSCSHSCQRPPSVQAYVTGTLFLPAGPT